MVLQALREQVDPLGRPSALQRKTQGVKEHYLRDNFNSMSVSEITLARH